MLFIPGRLYLRSRHRTHQRINGFFWASRSADAVILGLFFCDTVGVRGQQAWTRRCPHHIGVRGSSSARADHPLWSCRPAPPYCDFAPQAISVTCQVDLSSVASERKLQDFRICSFREAFTLVPLGLIVADTRVYPSGDSRPAHTSWLCLSLRLCSATSVAAVARCTKAPDGIDGRSEPRQP